jgi:hypothetical protein
MAKSKAETESLENEEDFDDENETEGEEESEEKEESGAKKKSEASDEEDSSTDDSEDESSSEDKAAKEQVDADREAIRERRRREKKMRRERDKRERLQMQNLVVSLQQEVRQLKEGAGKELYDEVHSLKKERVQDEMRQAANLYKEAEEVMKQAIKEGDGDAYVKAKRISDSAYARYHQLESTAKTRPAVAGAGGGVASRSAREDVADAAPAVNTDQNSAASVLTTRGKQMAISWATKHSGWYDADGRNRESKIVMTIDEDLFAEGYDPNTKEYWDELDDRVKEILPHRYKAGSAPRAKQTVGGGGAEGASSASSVDKTLPPEFVRTLKAAGYWEDPVKKKAAIKNFYASKRKA